MGLDVAQKNINRPMEAFLVVAGLWGVTNGEIDLRTLHHTYQALLAVETFPIFHQL